MRVSEIRVKQIRVNQGLSVYTKYLKKGPFKYYVIKEVGRWGQYVAIFDDFQYCKSSKRWVGLKR